MSTPLTAEQLADALSCFGNSAIQAMHNGTADIAAIAQGVDAVMFRLKQISEEQAKDDQSSLSEDWPVVRTPWRPMDCIPRDGSLVLIQVAFPDFANAQRIYAARYVPANSTNGRFMCSNMWIDDGCMECWMPAPEPY